MSTSKKNQYTIPKTSLLKKGQDKKVQVTEQPKEKKSYTSQAELQHTKSTHLNNCTLAAS